MPTSRAFALGCALLGLVAGCSSGSSKSTSSTSTTRRGATTTTSKPRTTTSTTAPVTATSMPEDAALAALVPTTVPSGFLVQPNNLADTGPTDFKKAAQDDAGAMPTQALLLGGFQRGYQRQWAGTRGVDQNFLWLYQFATPAGAEAYVQHWLTTLQESSRTAKIESYTPPYIPGARGLRVEDNLASRGVVLFAKGPYAVQAVATGGPGTDQAGAANGLALAQYGRLP